MPVTDRLDLFSASVHRRGLTAEIIEKDFWVCWTLKRVFTFLEKADNNVSEAARQLGMHRQNLQQKMAALGIRK